MKMLMRFCQVAVVLGLAAARAADVAPADASAWSLKDWKGAIVLPAGNYRGPEKGLHLEKDCHVIVSPGTLIKDAQFGGGGAKWKVDGSLFRKVSISGDMGERLEAKDSAFEECSFSKGGGWFVAYWSTRWIFENCVFSKKFFPSKWHVGDYSVCATDCTFYDLTMPKIGYKDDPSGEAQSKELKFEHCRFVKCELPESALAATIDCVFEDCQFTTQDKPNWTKAKKPIVVNVFLAAARTKPPKSYSNGPLQVNFQTAAPAQRAGSTLAVTHTGAGLHYPAILGTGPVAVLGDGEQHAVAKTEPAAAPVIPAAAAAGSYVGRWSIHFTDNSVRTYDIGARGEVLFIEENKHGQLRRSPDGIILELGDGRLERLKFSGTIVSVDRFESKATFPANPPMLSGTGTLVNEVAAAPTQTTATTPLAASSSAAGRLAAAAQTQYNQSISAAGQGYLRELNSALQGAMRSGDLDDANAIKAAMDQIKSGQVTSLKFKSAYANTARTRYEQAVSVALQQYARDLEAAQKEALSAGNLDEANAINATRKQMERR